MDNLSDFWRSHRRLCVGFILAFAGFAAVLNTINDPGVTWDEPFAIGASELYVDWYLGGLNSADITRHWQANHEHPPLAKTLMGITRRPLEALTGNALGVMGSRLSTALFFAAMITGVFLMASDCAGEVAGVSAALCLMLMPRVFGHAHLAELDLPAACLWLWTALAFARGIESRRWSVAAAVLFGLALLTRFDAALVAVPIAFWGLIVHRRRALFGLIAMALIGPVVFFIGWPWLWVDTWTRLAGYLKSNLGRTEDDRWIVQSYYFGKAYITDYPPWHYPAVMTALTVPVGILAAAVCGGVLALRSIKLKPLHALVLGNAAFILLLFSMPSAPRYDGVRLLLALFPFLAILGGIGVAAVHAKLPKRIRFTVDSTKSRGPVRFVTRPIGIVVKSVFNALFGRFAAAACVVFFVTQSWGIIATHPCELSYYNLLAGGVSGAHEMGMETTYWGDSVTWEAFDFLAAGYEAAPPARVAFFPRSEFIKELWINDGYVTDDRIDVVDFGERWDFAVIYARRSMIETTPQAKKLWDEAEPVWRLTRDGIDLCRIYKR